MRSRDREAAIAEGVALVAGGASYPAASAAVGVPKSTLHEWAVKTLGPDANGREAALAAAEQRLVASAMAAATGIVGRMADEYETAEPNLLAGWAKASSTVLGRLRGWDGKGGGELDSTPRWVSAVSHLLDQGGATLTVTLAPRDTEAK